MRDPSEKTFRFGDYELSGAKRTLFRAGEPLSLNSKTLDLLLALVENHGRAVPKSELLERVWPGQFVEDNNLSVQIATLRKVFGDKQTANLFVKTVPGIGYKFVHDVEETIPPAVAGNGRVGIADAAAGRGIRRYVAALVLVIALIAVGGLAWRYSKSSGGAVFINSNVRQLTTSGKVGLAVISPDGRHFAYTINDFGQRSLLFGIVDGGNHVTLRPPSESANYYQLAFSPDGVRLYFTCSDERTPAPALYRMPVSGGVTEKLMDGVSNFSLSPDGARIAFRRVDAAARTEILTIANIDGGGGDRRDIISLPLSSQLPSINPATVAWSPDGARLAFAGAEKDAFKYDLVVVDAVGGEAARIKSGVWRDISRVAWMPDGGSLVIAAALANSWASVIQFRLLQVQLPDGAVREITTDRSIYADSLSLSGDAERLLSVEHRQLNNIWVAPADDLGAARQITYGSFGKYDGLWGLDFTPDGKIVYTNSDAESQFISKMNSDGSDQTPLTAPGLIDSVLNVSNDGRYIVFHSNRQQGFDIWRMNSDGTNPVQMTFGRENYQPFVSADNRWIYYKSLESGVGELRRVPIEGGGKPETIAANDASWVSFSPDGKYFAAAHRTDAVRLAIFSAATNRPVREFKIPKGGSLSFGSHWTADSRSVVYRDVNFGYWRQPVEGGDAKRLEGLPKEKFYNFSFSRDGKLFAFVRGQEIRDVVVIENAKQ